MAIYKTGKRKYYKYGTELNAIVNGTFAKIDKGVASGFSASQYLKFPELFRPENNTWEMVFKITTGSNLTTAQYIMALGKGFTEATRYATRIGIHEDKNFVISVSYNGTAWDIVGGSTAGAKGSHTVSPNTTYYLKYEFTGGAYKLSYSLDGVDYIQDCYVESTTPMYNSNTANLIGVWNNGSYINPFLGSIDLSQSYININGSRWWSGKEYTKVGSWIDDGVVGRFSSSNYTRLPFTFEGGSYNNWELVTKIKVNSYSSGPAILCVNSSYGIFNYAITTSGRVQLALSTNTDSFNICSDTGEKVLDLNTWYWYKAEFTGTAYNTYWSIDGKVWNLDSSVQKSTKLGNISALNFGIRTKNNDEILDGYIDMQETYFKANGVDVWHGTKTVETTPDDAVYSAVEPDKIKDIYKATERKYYKYDYLNWTQPVLTSNTSDSSFIVSASSELDASLAAWKSFDGVIDSNCWISASVDISEEAPQYYYIKTDTPLKISSISVTNRTGSYPHSVTKGVLQASVNGDSWIDIVQINNDIVSSGATWVIEANETAGYKYHRIKITDYYLGGDSSKYVALGHLVITAQKAVGVELNVNGSDIYQDFVQPVLTANGTMGGDKFAVRGERTSSQPAYYAYDGNGSTYLQLWSLDANETFFYNPNPLKVSKLDFVYYPETWITSGEIYGSNDDSNYILLTTFSHSTNSGSVAVNNEVGYKYFKIKVLGANGSTGSQRIIADIYTLTITAQERVAVGGTIDDADYSDVLKKRIVAAYKTGKRKYYKYSTEPNATIAGSPTIVDGVVSGFSTSQYLKLPTVFNPQSNPWEALFKVKINTLINGSQVILGQRNSGGYDFYVDVNTVRLGVGNTIFTGTTTLQENTTYWFKYTFTGDTYIVKSSTNGVDWVDEINTESTVTATPTSDDCRIGVWYNTYASGLGNPFKGSIDLNESYININGQRWWHGTKAYQVNLGGEGIYEDWKQPTLTANGTLGGNTFAVRANQLDDSHPAYKAFDKSASTYWYNSASGDAEYYIYNPNPLCITNIEVKNRADGDADNEITSGAVYGSDDGNAWTELVSYTNTVNALGGTWQIPLTENKTYYKYYKIAGTNASRYVAVSEFTLTAKELVAVGSDVYDYSAVETPQLVYNLKYNLNSNSAYAKEGTVSGTNRFGTDTGATTSENLNQTSIFTFNTPAPAGKWTGSFQYYSQVNFSMNQVYWRLTYEDGTQEYAYGPTGLGDTAYGGGERATISISFTAKKPIKTVTVYAQGSGGGSGRYGGLEYIQMFFDGTKQ